MTRQDCDPFVLEVFRHSLDTIADQMAVTLMHAAYSGIVRDSMDFSTAVCDAEGRTLAQGLTVPLHLGSFHDAMTKLIAEHRRTMAVGDVFIFNDPYEAAGQHLPDIYIIRPVFVGERLVAFATTIAHHADVGGIVPGSNALNAVEIFQEGLRLPILKFIERGRPVQPIWDIIRLNVRVPDLVLGDLEAQVAAAATGECELLDLWGRMGVDEAAAYVEHLHDYAERLARAEIAEMPDGVYRFTDHVEGLGDDPTPVILELTLTIAGDQATVDWTGSSAQVAGGINSVFPFTKACSYTALRSVMAAEIPNCFGYTRPIVTIAPPGTVMNPVSPGACGARGITGYRMIDCLMGALAQAVPDRVTADGNGGSTLPTIAGRHAGKPFIFCETFMGTWGATTAHDGQEGVPHLGANQANVSIEMIEAGYPLRIERYAIVPDTGGPGRFAGGHALRRDYRLLADDAVLMVRSDKRLYPPHGLAGGGCGQPSSNVINPGTQDRILPVMVIEPIALKRGDLFVHVTAGAGGYGDPLERPPERVLKDVLQGRISREHAVEAYGVELGHAAMPALDEPRTRQRRAEIRRARKA